MNYNDIKLAFPINGNLLVLVLENKLTGDVISLSNFVTNDELCEKIMDEITYNHFYIKNVDGPYVKEGEEDKYHIYIINKIGSEYCLYFNKLKHLNLDFISKIYVDEFDYYKIYLDDNLEFIETL